MKVYEPTPPNMTIAEIEDQDPLGYKIIIEVVRQSAFYLYRSSPATNKLGLEKCMESLLELLDSGEAKLIMQEDPDGNIENDMVFMGFFNPATGKYQIPGEETEIEDEEYYGPIYDEDGNIPYDEDSP